MVRRDAEQRDIQSFCERCKKVTYLNRASARRANRRTKQHGNMSSYPCPFNEQVWHNGHLPASVRTGARSKDSYVKKARERKVNSAGAELERKDQA